MIRLGIIIGGDIVPFGPDISLFTEGKVDELVGQDLLTILRNASYRIFNLEVPLTDTCQPIQKYGPHLVAPTAVTKGLQLMGVDLLTLANNHIMDQGILGLTSTIQELKNANISYVGVGQNQTEAQKAFFFYTNNKRYGVYACAEHEFSIVDNKQPGANPFDPLESLDHVKKMKTQCDYVIVLYHGGKEYYRYPSPNLQKVCRKLVEKGADLVVCQHSHCIGCKEEYLNGTIVYGQGNFLFNKKSNEFWNTGIIVSINDIGEITYIPFTKQEHGIRLAQEREASEIIEAFEKRSKEIKEPNFIDEKYKSFADEEIPGYLLFFLGMHKNVIYRIVNKLSGQRLKRFVISRILNNRGMGIKLFIQCEAHRELLLKGLQ